jgi:hypothetical protein
MADVFSAPDITMLHQVLERVSPVWWGFCVGMTAAIDLYGVAKARKNAPEYFPGNLGFDPLVWYPKNRSEQEQMKLAEIKHGRVAMLGVLVYVIQEFITKMQ